MLRTSCRLSLTFALLLATGCGDKEVNDAPDVSEDLGADVAPEPDMGPAVMCPGEGQLFCDGKCVEATFDLDHCGACGNACTRGAMTCMMGECLCLGDSVMCDGECADTTTDRDNCGSCGNACGSDQTCISSSCVDLSENPTVLGVLDETNKARAAQQDCGENGIFPAVGALTLNDDLSTAAQRHAEDMAAKDYLEHDAPDGSTPSTRARDAGYTGSSVGENIARGQDSPAAAVAAWVDSDGHCSNMMQGDYDELGVGHATAGDGTQYWVQVFGGM